MDERTSIWTNHIWTDYSRGQSLITYGNTAAVTLQAVLPMWVGFIGNAFWNILRLAIWHWYWRAQEGRPDAFLEQRKLLIMIRNSDGSFELCQDILFEWLRWRRSRRTVSGGQRSARLWSFPLLIMMLGSLHFSGWIVLGIIVGQVWSPAPGISDQGLLKGGTCGTINTTDTRSIQQQIAYVTYDNNGTNAADVYARQCYAGASVSTGACDYFCTRKLSFTKNDAECPFGVVQSSCLTDVSTPYRMDTGFLDSAVALGINAAPENSIAFRKVTTCSPTTSQDRSSIVNYNQTTDQQLWPPQTQLYRFFYGSISNGSSGVSFASDWTYEYASWKPELNLKYDVSAFSYFGGAPVNLWAPNATFWDAKRLDADVALFFVNGDHVVYQFPNNDPVFATGASYTEPLGDGTSATQYTPQYYVNVLACIDQYQICSTPHPPSPNDAACTPLSALYQLSNAIWKLKMNRKRQAIAERIIKMYPTLSTYNAVDGRGAAAFLASLSLKDTLQTARLPDDHWRKEVANWFAISLAKLQQEIVDYAAAPAGAAVQETLIPPASKEEKEMCHSQRIKLPANYVNFSMSGIWVVLFLGLAVWILGQCVEKLVGWALEVSGRHEQRRSEWDALGSEGVQGFLEGKLEQMAAATSPSASLGASSTAAASIQPATVTPPGSSGIGNVSSTTPIQSTSSGAAPSTVPPQPASAAANANAAQSQSSSNATSSVTAMQSVSVPPSPSAAQTQSSSVSAQVGTGGASSVTPVTTGSKPMTAPSSSGGPQGSSSNPSASSGTADPAASLPSASQVQAAGQSPSPVVAAQPSATAQTQLAAQNSPLQSSTTIPLQSLRPNAAK